MTFPKKLHQHDVPTWVHKDCFHTNNEYEYIKSYYHRINSTIGMHDHGFYEINIIVEGSGRHYIENQSCSAEVGMVFIIPPNIKHGYYAEEYLNIFHILISGAFMEHYHDEIVKLPGYALLFEIEPYLRGEYSSDLFLTLSEKELSGITEVFGKLCTLQVSNYAGREILKNVLCLNLIGEFCQIISDRSLIPGMLQQNPYMPAIVRSMEYIRSHFSEKFSFKELSADLNMSYSTYLRHFEDICGCSPKKYLQECRITKARELLTHTQKSILTIAHECGYYDSSHFIRSFYEVTGMNPLNFRSESKLNWKA